jgi:transposase InsO family protein
MVGPWSLTCVPVDWAGVEARSDDQAASRRWILAALALREAVLVGIRHYNGHRPHQSLGNQPPVPLQSTKPDVTKPVIRVDLLGGAIHEYGRAA